jgi:hypothetical protein
MSDLRRRLREAAALRHLRANFHEQEAEALQRIASLMERNGYRDTGELLAAIERGDVELTADETEALVRLGAL